MRYLDTSLVVAAVTNENGTAAAQRILASADDDLAISDWVITEVSAALSLKVRAGVLAETHRRVARSAFARLADSSLHVLPVTAADFRSAADLAERHKTGLRAGDVLHLAVATASGAAVYTLDKGLARAARSMRLATVLVS